MIIDQILILLGLKGLSYAEIIWLMVGMIGQLIFFSRWILQWWVSEKQNKSTIPLSFWWCSLIGGGITLIYAFHIKSLPFILAQFMGIIVYFRNIYLIIKEKNKNGKVNN